MLIFLGHRLTNHWVFSLQFLCNDVCLLQEHQNTVIM